MNITLLCPDDASRVPSLARKVPLVLTPFLGQTVIEHALAGLAGAGAKNVRIVAPDRPDEISRVVGRGEAWGITVEVLSVEDRIDFEASMTAAAAAASPAASSGAKLPACFLLDHLPQAPQHPLWQSYRGWYAAQQTLLPTLARERVGMREVKPGVFVGLRSQVAPDASLAGPCWIGANVRIGPRAVIGAGAIIGDGAYVDEGVEVAGSILGPQTYLGSFTELRDSFAWGTDLLNLDSGSLIEVTDRFLLSEVQSERGFFGRLVDAVRGTRKDSPGPGRGAGQEGV